MKDVATPASQQEVRGVIKKALENAALVNYERLSEEARIECTYLCLVLAQGLIFTFQLLNLLIQPFSFNGMFYLILTLILCSRSSK